MNYQANETIFPGQRQALIRSRLAAEGRVVAADLARELATSEDTIRRDLRQLAEAGLCRRVYGGALPVSPAGVPLAMRRGQGQAGKEGLATAALRLLQPGMSVVLDAGSTNLAVARLLPDDLRLTVITNALSVAAVVEPKAGVDLILLGGRHDRATGGCLGAVPLQAAARLRPDVYLLGTCALDPGPGLTAFNPEEAELKRALADTGAAVVALVTDDKLGTRAPHAVIPWTEVHHLVVETATSLASRCGPCPDQGPRVIVAGA